MTLYRFVYKGIREVHAKNFGDAVKKITTAFPETKPIPVISLQITETLFLHFFKDFFSFFSFEITVDNGGF